MSFASPVPTANAIWTTVTTPCFSAPSLPKQQHPQPRVWVEFPETWLWSWVIRRAPSRSQPDLSML